MSFKLRRLIKLSDQVKFQLRCRNNFELYIKGFLKNKFLKFLKFFSKMFKNSLRHSLSTKIGFKTQIIK
jgi:hypothetical protein